MNHRDWQNAQYKKWGVELPEHIEHGTEEDIKKKLKPLKMKNWRMEGNKLICDTPKGKLVNFLPTNVICVGEENGLPKLQKIKVQYYNSK